MACFRQSKRRAAQFLSTILNQPASAAWMVLLQNRCADAVQPAYDELATQLPKQDILHIDESPTKEGAAKSWVWTIVAKTLSFFACRTSRGGEVPKQLLGANFAGVIHCDRAKDVLAVRSAPVVLGAPDPRPSKRCSTTRAPCANNSVVF